jgi:hypothetical protein
VRRGDEARVLLQYRPRAHALGAALGWRWVQRLLYYRAPEWVFTVIYLAWAAATLATLRLIPPRR